MQIKRYVVLYNTVSWVCPRLTYIEIEVMFRGGFCSVCQVDVSALELLNSSIGFCFKWSISLHEQFLFISAMGIQIMHIAF